MYFSTFAPACLCIPKTEIAHHRLWDLPLVVLQTIILLPANDMGADIVTGLESGVDDYRASPFYWGTSKTECGTPKGNLGENVNENR